MKAIGILMSDPMALAALAGRKTQTRRIIDPERVRVRLLQKVCDDLSDVFPDAKHTIAKPGPRWARIYAGGAASVIADDGNPLGIKPSEFEWVGRYGPVGRRK